MNRFRAVGPSAILAFAALALGAQTVNAEIIRLDVTASVTSVDAGLQPLGFAPSDTITLIYFIDTDAEDLVPNDTTQWISLNAILSSSFSLNGYSFDSLPGGNTAIQNSSFDRFRIFHSNALGGFSNVSSNWGNVTIDDTTLTFGGPSGPDTFWTTDNPIVITQPGILNSISPRTFVLDTNVGFVNATVTNATAVVVPAPSVVTGMVVVGLLAARRRR